MNRVWSTWSRSKFVRDITNEAIIGPAVKMTSPISHGSAAHGRSSAEVRPKYGTMCSVLGVSEAADTPILRHIRES